MQLKLALDLKLALRLRPCLRVLLVLLKLAKLRIQVVRKHARKTDA